MDYWHEIVKRYDAPESNGSRSKDHGTFSQKNTVILLIYLAFGTDYPSGIAKYFSELRDREQLVNDCPSGTAIAKYFSELKDREKPVKVCPGVLMISSKISSLLKRMERDKLVNLGNSVSVRAGIRSYYVLNPQILQAPTKDSNYLKCDGSLFMIPPGPVEGFLGWLTLKQAGTIDKGKQEQLDKQVRQERHKRADIIFDRLFHGEKIDYLEFLSFIKAEAKEWESQRKSGNELPVLSNAISDYIRELDSIHRDEILREWDSCVD